MDVLGDMLALFTLASRNLLVTEELFVILEPGSVSDKYRMPRAGQEGPPDQDKRDDAREKSQNAPRGIEGVCVRTAE